MSPKGKRKQQKKGPKRKKRNPKKGKGPDRYAVCQESSKKFKF